ncbi:hypothetical protein ACE1MK_07355 [Tenacibaculum maritimum]|uniref:hypothetical protein n=1 Tax=Tenacibaculum maritimum TaxID=107401 RepID=UPI0012E4EB7E|nr:hypothetical protein [Tenacibaculum maritimum]CAA0245479.1 hypothetical protein TMP139_660002 [Tenacibaculum maritimum]CAA0253856.1 hypothetical protein USCSP91_750004 [Tenacibaculum maritimum]
MKRFFSGFVPIFLILAILFVFFFDSFKRLGKWFSPDNYGVSLDDSKSIISDLKASSIADILHVSMASMGTDFVRIKDVLSGLSVHDYAKVHNKFGVRGYIDSLGVGVDIPLSLRLNLTQWFESELSRSELFQLRSMYPFIS